MPGKPTGRSFRLIVAALLFVFLGQALLWGARKGAILRVQRTDQSVAEGELVAVRETKLIFVDSSSRDLTIDINDVNFLTIDKKAHPWIGAALGMILGGIVGFAVAPSEKVENIWEAPVAVTEEFLGRTGYGLAGALAGGVLGGVIGGALGSDSQIIVARMSPDEREHLLSKLRSKARVKNAS